MTTSDARIVEIARRLCAAHRAKQVSTQHRALAELLRACAASEDK